MLSQLTAPFVPTRVASHWIGMADLYLICTPGPVLHRGRVDSCLQWQIIKGQKTRAFIKGEGRRPSETPNNSYAMVDTLGFIFLEGLTVIRLPRAYLWQKVIQSYQALFSTCLCHFPREMEVSCPPTTSFPLSVNPALPEVGLADMLSTNVGWEQREVHSRARHSAGRPQLSVTGAKEVSQSQPFHLLRRSYFGVTALLQP